MNKNIEQLPIIKLVGITACTSNGAEMNPSTAKIGTTMQRFFMDGMQDKISHRKNPGKVFAVYTNYESDEHGAYTYFLGEEVTSFENIGQEFEMLTIPTQTYVKFTSNSGEIPEVVIDMWQNIWKMDASELGGKRVYVADFEIYDERSRDPSNAILDIYIGIKI
jgi:predicted transcriptional regulator YdeE